MKANFQYSVLPIALVCSGLLMASASAAVFVTMDPSAPSENVIAYNEPGGDYGGRNTMTAYYTKNQRTGNNAQFRQMGQAFTMQPGTSGEMTAVSWLIGESSGDGVWGKNFVIRIYSTDGQNVSPADGHLESTQKGKLPVDPSLTVDTYFTFTLETPIELKENTTYVVVFGFDEPTSTDAKVVNLSFLTTGNAVPNSDWQRWTFEGGFSNGSPDVWKTSIDDPNGSVAGNRNQPIFYVHGTMIPEPSFYSFVGVGLAAGVAFRWRRR